MSDPPRRLRRAGWVAVICVIALVLPALYSLTREVVPPAMTPAPPEIAASARSVVLVLVDGLRHDFASDPKHAPNFARNMQRHSSAEVWAGRITMTSAAVLAFGTATRGSFTQVVLNVEARRTRANHLFENARAAGIDTGLIGDPVWRQAYGDFDYQVLSKGELALDVDDSPELFEVAHAALRKGELPRLLVLHFFATDHLQHSFGVFSAKYGELFLRFDANLQKFLDALPETTTVIVLSDHGALSNGNHGVDSDLERKTPLFAYGPGVRPGQRLRLEQVDVAPTIAALLGISSPAHGVGMPATELIDAPAPKLSNLSCAEAARISELGHVLGANAMPGADTSRENLALCGDAGQLPVDRIAAARRVARHWDTAIDEASAQRGVRGFFGAALVALLFGAAMPLLLGLRSIWVVGQSVLAVGITAALSISMTAFVDRTLPPWNDTRAVVLWLTTGLLALCLSIPRLGERIYTRLPFAALAIAPGFLFASFPTNTQLHSGVVASVCCLTALVTARRAGMTLREIALPLLAGALGSSIALRLATVREDPLQALSGTRGIVVGIALAMIWLGVAAALSRRTELGRVLTELAIGVPLVVIAVLPHGWVPAAAGLSALVILPVSAYALARRGRWLLARACLFAAYGLVSRPIELAAVAGGALLAESVGMLLGRARPDSPAAPLGSWQIVVAATSTFAIAYSVRLGVQGGLDFVTMDWGAAAFDSEMVPASRITLALMVKYGAALALVGVVLLSWLPAGARHATLELLTAGLVLRLATMAAILFAPWVSFWSRYRMLGELGPVAVMCVLAALGLLLLGYARAPSDERGSLPSPGRS